MKLFSRIYAWRLAAILSLVLTIRWAFEGNAVLYVIFVALTIAFTSQAVRMKLSQNQAEPLDALNGK